MRLIILLISIVLFISLCFYIFSSQTKRVDSSSETPILFIHGYLGSQKSLGTMIKRFEQNGWGNKIVYCVVHADGTLYWKTTGKIKEGTLPLIHVVFKRADASVQEQKQWVEQIIEEVKKIYKVSSVHIVAHSMGGLTATAVSLSVPQHINKLVTLGSPIKGLDHKELMEMYPKSREHQSSLGARDLSFGSNALQEIYINRHTFARHIEVFSGAGDIGDRTDGVVTVSSAHGLEDFTPEVHLQTFHEAHSDLHESKEVDKVVYQFLKGN
ncbi:alpha/beta fold hydrolase [Priestia megaterium]|nr:alpha/beta fold hydrolase [Priestia megaterium]